MIHDRRAVLIAEAGGTYGFLLGVWRIERTLTDRRRCETGVFSGTATIEPHPTSGPQTARYQEVGQLCIGTYRGTAQRSLRYVRQEHGAVAVDFEDGRRFVACDLRSGRWRATHLCGDDRYDISWRLHARDVVAERWRVRGPNKDYEAVSVLRRAR